MNYLEVLDILKKQGHKRILVTGPQRSGTTFAGFVISEELGIKYFREEAIKLGSVDLFKELDKENNEYILQTPRFAPMCHNMGFDAVVYMRRNLDDIAKSMKRLHPRITKYMKALINKYYGHEYDSMIFTEALYLVLEKEQLTKADNIYILDYESLSTHKLWIEKEKRVNKNGKPWSIRRVRLPS